MAAQGANHQSTSTTIQLSGYVTQGGKYLCAPADTNAHTFIMRKLKQWIQNWDFYKFY